MESTRSRWSDERMDSFSQRTEENFREVRTDIHDVRAEIRDLRSEMNARFAHLDRRFDLMFGAMITGFVGLILTHFLG